MGKKRDEKGHDVHSLVTKEAPRRKFPGIEEVSAGFHRIRVRRRSERTGKMLERDRVVKCTEREALVVQAKWYEELGVESQPPARLKVGDFAKSWLSGKLNVLLPPTIDRYTQALDDHILPAIGEYFLDALRHEDLVKWRDAKKAEGYRAATVNGMLRIIKGMLADAGALHGLANPAARVATLPEDDTRITDDEPNTLTADEARAFLKAAKDRWPDHHAMIFTLLVTGARMSAICALRWEDIDMESGRIRFRRRRYKNEVYGGVKGRTPAARKKVLEVALTEEHKAVLEVHRARLTPFLLESGWVFPSKVGGLHANSVLDKPFKDLREHLGIVKRFTPHGLRRTCTDLTRQVSSAVVTKSITGHLTDAMHEHYSTVSLEEKRAAMGKVIRLVHGGGSGGEQTP